MFYSQSYIKNWKVIKIYFLAISSLTNTIYHIKHVLQRRCCGGVCLQSVSLFILPSSSHIAIRVEPRLLKCVALISPFSRQIRKICSPGKSITTAYVPYGTDLPCRYVITLASLSCAPLHDDSTC